IEVSSLDDILADVHHYVEKLISNKRIMYLDYLVIFKPEKVVGSEAQLVDMQDYKKFLLDYKKLSDG
ncbi:15946_t:CDS:1, partial [Funneliformis mosseae]